MSRIVGRPFLSGANSPVTEKVRLAWGMDSKLLHDMFVLTVPVAEKILRPIVVYAFLIVGLRLAGKRELAQLNPFDLIVLLDAVQHGPERHHWRRQQRDRRSDWCGHVASD